MPGRLTPFNLHEIGIRRNRKLLPAEELIERAQTALPYFDLTLQQSNVVRIFGL